MVLDLKNSKVIPTSMLYMYMQRFRGDNMNRIQCVLACFFLSITLPLGLSLSASTLFTL